MLAEAETHSALIQRAKNLTKVRSRPSRHIRGMALQSDPTLDVRQYLENLVRIAVDSGQQAEDISIEARQDNRKARRGMALVASVGALGLIVGIAGFTASRSANLRLSEVHDEVSALQNLKKDVASIQQQRKAEEAALARETAGQQAMREALQREITDLRQQADLLRTQIAQRSQDRELPRTEAMPPHKELDGLVIPPTKNEPIPDTQQGREALQQLIAGRQQQQDPITPTSREPRSALAAATGLPRQNPSTPSREDIQDISQSRQQGNVAHQRRQGQTIAVLAHRGSSEPLRNSDPLSPQPGAMLVQGPGASEQLLMARQSLMTGRPDEARRLLALAQMQMVFQPVGRIQHPSKDAMDWLLGSATRSDGWTWERAGRLRRRWTKPRIALGAIGDGGRHRGTGAGEVGAGAPARVHQSRGNRMVNSLYSPTLLSTVMLPPCCWVTMS
jgi:hypothetical protein